MATSSARKRSVPVRATATSYCNRIRAPPNAVKSAKVTNPQNTFQKKLKPIKKNRNNAINIFASPTVNDQNGLIIVCDHFQRRPPS